jgi:hypothetical protein
MVRDLILHLRTVPTTCYLSLRTLPALIRALQKHRSDPEQNEILLVRNLRLYLRGRERRSGRGDRTWHKVGRRAAVVAVP